MKVQLELPPVKKRAITEPGYGNNAKVLVGFRSRPWQTLGYSGSTFSDQAFQSAPRAETRSDPQVGTVAAELCFNPRSAPNTERLRPLQKEELQGYYGDSRTSTSVRRLRMLICQRTKGKPDRIRLSSLREIMGVGPVLEVRGKRFTRLVVR